MRSNKEHVRAQTFLTQRLHTAAVTGLLDDWEPPSRRTSVGAAIGTVLAVLIVLGLVAYGFIRPAGGPVLAEGTTVVVEKETGTRYLVDGTTLRPVANLASVMLVTGPEPAVQQLSRQRTAELERGEPLGIPGAPEDVPPPTDLTTSGWTWCAPSAVGAREQMQSPRPVLAFEDPATVRPLPEERGLLVADPSGAVYLVVGDQRFGIPSSQVRSALGYDLVDPVRVPESWLASLSPGRPLRPPVLSGVGEPGPQVDGQDTRVGQILTAFARTADPDYLLVRGDDVVALTALERTVLLTDDRIAAVNREAPETLLPAGEAVASSGERLPGGIGWPANPPEPAETSGMPACVAGDAAGDRWVGLLDPAGDGTTGPVDTRADGSAVRVPPGSAALVAVVDPSGTVTGSVLLVDDVGRAYPIGSAEAQAALGYEGVAPVPLPAPLLAALPAGPVLDTTAIGGAAVVG